MSKRNIEKHILMNKAEAQDLQKKAKRACLSEGGLIRLLLKGYEPREKPDERFYDVMRELSAIGNNINQLAAKANTLGFVDAPQLKKEAERWHMNDGTMFAGLMKFKDKSFWKKHKTVSFDTLTDRQTYEVIAVFKTVVYTDSPDSFKYYQFVNAETSEDFTAYVEKCKELSLYETGITAEYGDKLLTLSTCEYSRTNGRLVVVAKLINE